MADCFIRNEKYNEVVYYVEEKDKDFLTMLYNRRYLNQYENKVYNYVDNYEFSIIMLDIDYFKLYNDNYGHVKGDKVVHFDQWIPK